MAHSGKTMTFATDLVPQENNIYNLGQENLKWIIRGSLPLSDITSADDLKAIEAISGTTGLLKKTAANTWTLDTNTYLTTHRTYTAVSGKKPTGNQTPGFGSTFDIEQVGQDATGQVSVTERTVKIPDTAASANTAGLVNTDAQVFSGIKTFMNGIEIKGHITGDSSTTTGHGLYSGGMYHNAYNNIILHGDASTGSSGIAFVSDKIAANGTITNINAPSDRAFIQYHACGVTTATAEGSAPTIATSGEAGRLVIGIGNDSGDRIILQAPGTTDIIHQMGMNGYPIPHTANTNGTVGGTTTPVYVEAGVIKAGTALGGAAYKAENYYALSGHNHDTLYIKRNSELLTTNSFAPQSLTGPYISKIDNAFYAADKRWTVTGTNISSIPALFDGNYESNGVISAGKTATITIDFDPNHNNSAYFPGYPYGYILISFYYTSGPSNVSARVYCNYNAHGIGWHNLAFSPIDDNDSTHITYRSEHQGSYNISQLEFTITAGSSDVRVTQIEMHLDRPNSAFTPFLSKYNAETLYYDLTAPKFIGSLQGNADSATTATTATNLANNPSIQTSGTTQITITTGGKTSSAYTVPYATNASTTTTLSSTAKTTEAACMPSSADRVQAFRTSSDSTGLTNDGHIIGFTWSVADKYGAQIFIDTDPTYKIALRQRDSGGTWQAWKNILTSNTTSAGTNNTATLNWNTTYTIAKIDGTDIKFTTMAKPSYSYSDIGSRPTSIKLTGAVTGSVTLGNGENSIATTVNHNHDDRYKIASGVITLGSNTITPVTSIAELTGSTITAANLRTNLGLSAALRFIGKATTDMSESTTTAPTVTGVTNYVPEIGDVVLDKNSDAEYVCIAKSSSTYTWELLGRSGSWATSDHTHGNITNGGLLGAANMAVVTDGSKKITTADLSVSDSNASTNATTTFVQAVTQSAQGKITVTKASLNTSGEWSGNAGTATAIKTAGTTAQFYRGDNSWSNILKQTAASTLGIDTNRKIGTAIKNLHFTVGSGSGTGINDGNAGGITIGTDTASYGGIYWQSSGAYGLRLHFATTGSFANGAYTRMLITHDGKVGIGTLSPDTLLTVNGNAKADKFIGALQGNADTAGKWATARTLTIGNKGQSVDGSGNVSWSLADIGAAASNHEHNYIGNSRYIAYTADGHYEGSGTTIGYIKIRIPKTKSATMLSFDVDIYNYSGDTSTRYHIAGYNYIDASWNSTTAYCIAPLSNTKANLTVRFLSNGNDEMYVTIGEPDTSWSYPKVNVHNIVMGHSGNSLDNWASGWTITITDTAFTSSQIKATKTNTNVAYTSITAGTSTLAWNEEKTLYTIGNAVIKAKLPAMPSYSDVGAAPASTVSCTAANVQSILGINTSSGSTSKALTEKGTWVTFGTSNLTIGTTSTTAMAGNTTVTNVAISANVTTNANYPIVFATSNKDTTGAKNEGLQKSGAKFYFNPSTGNVASTLFNNLTLTAATTGFTIAGGTTSKTLTVAGTATINAPTQWGIVYGGASGAYTSTAAGSSGQYLKSNGSAAPTWASFSASTVGLGNVTNEAQIPKSIGTAKGDIIYFDGNASPKRLAIGTSGQVLKVASGIPSWGTDNNDDTKNTAGSTNSTAKLFLIGAESQDANPVTHSYQYTYASNGLLSSTYLGLNDAGNEKVRMAWNDNDSSLEFIFA